MNKKLNFSASIDFRLYMEILRYLLIGKIDVCLFKTRWQHWYIQYFNNSCKEIFQNVFEAQKQFQ